MAVTNFSVQNAAVNLSGLWSAFGSPTVFGGHNLMHKVGIDSRIDVVLTGTDCKVNTYQIWNVSIDGAAEVNVGDSSGSVVNATLFSGLSDTAHTVSMRAHNDCYIDHDSTDATHCSFSLTGAAPAISAASGFGTQVLLTGHSYIAKDQGWGTTTNGGYSLYLSSAFAGPSLRFYATCGTIKIWTYAGGQKFRLYIDGVDQTTVVAAGSANTYGWLQIATGLDSAAEHLYEIILTTQTATYAYALMTVGGTGINIARTPATRQLLSAYGDSIVSASAQGYPDTGSSFIQQLCLLKDWNCYNAGISGATVATVANGGSNSGITRYADITGLSPQSDICFVLYGTNDAFVLSRTTVQFQADYTTMMQALVDHGGTTIYYCLGILPRSSKTQAQIDTYNAAIVAAIAAVSPNTTLHYVDTKAWNMASAAYTSGGSFDATNFEDGLHPNPTGYLFMRNKLEDVLVPPVHGRRGLRLSSLSLSL